MNEIIFYIIYKFVILCQSFYPFLLVGEVYLEKKYIAFRRYLKINTEIFDLCHFLYDYYKIRKLKGGQINKLFNIIEIRNLFLFFKINMGCLLIITYRHILMKQSLQLINCLILYDNTFI